MPFIRPKAATRLSADEKQRLLLGYATEYAVVAADDPGALNRKLPRSAFETLLGRVGELLVNEAGADALRPGPVRRFLGDNPLPPSLAGLLPDAFRAYCLALNA